MDAKISILTPFKNASKFILETAHSIQAQTHTHWEWILINDHSDEHEESLLLTLLTDQRIKHYQNPGHGIIDALRFALEKSTGFYVTRMDADDIMPPNKLELFLDLISRNHCDVVTGKVAYFSSLPISEGYKKYEAWLNAQVEHQDFYTEIYRECTLASGNWFMKKETLLKVGGFDHLEYPEDYDLLFRWYQHDLKIIGIDQITHLWREHPQRTSRISVNYQQKSFFNLKLQRFLDLEFQNECIYIFGGGQKGKLAYQFLTMKNIPCHWVVHEIPNKNQVHFEHINWVEGSFALNTSLTSSDLMKHYFKQKQLQFTWINL